MTSDERRIVAWLLKVPGLIVALILVLYGLKYLGSRLGCGECQYFQIVGSATCRDT